MDVDVIKITQLMPEKRKRCIKEGLCFRCRKPRHLSGACPTFSSLFTPKKIRRVKQEKETEEQIPSLREVDDDDEEVVRRVTFSTDF